MIFLTVFFAVIGLLTRFKRGSKSSSWAIIFVGSPFIVSGHSCSVISHALSGKQIVNINPTTKPMKKKWFRFKCFSRMNCLILKYLRKYNWFSTESVLITIDWHSHWEKEFFLPNLSHLIIVYMEITKQIQKTLFKIQNSLQNNSPIFFSFTI